MSHLPDASSCSEVSASKSQMFLSVMLLMLFCNRWLGEEQNRVRRFWFGTRDGRKIFPEQATFVNPNFSTAVMACELTGGMSKKLVKHQIECRVRKGRSFQEMVRLQGLPEDFTLPPFTQEGRSKAVGNGVPLPMGRAIAIIIRRVKMPQLKGSIPWNKGKKMPQVSGQNSVHWKGGQHRQAEGYICIYMPEHPRCKSRPYVFEHILVVEKHLGRYLKPNEIVHHLNGKRDDNRLMNLVVMTRAEHLLYHNPKGHREERAKQRYHALAPLKEGVIPVTIEIEEGRR